jgi:hypothetical protein
MLLSIMPGTIKGVTPRDRLAAAMHLLDRGVGKPCQKLEGMMVAQLITAHNAAMDCYRRAAIPEQHAEARRENLV